MSSSIVDEVPVDPGTARVYAEGWQSWSPATWYPAGATGLARRGVAAPDAVPPRHAGRRRRASRPRGCSSSTPAPARRPAATARRTPLAVPTLRATLEGDRAGGPGRRRRCRRRTHPDGGEAALAAYADWLREARRRRRPGRAPTVWCSWYRYFEQVTSADVAGEPARLRRRTTCRSTWCRSTTAGAPGWARGCRVADRFGSLPDVVDGDPGLGSARRALAGAVPRRRRDHAGHASTRTGWSAPPATTGART